MRLGGAIAVPALFSNVKLPPSLTDIAQALVDCQVVTSESGAGKAAS